MLAGIGVFTVASLIYPVVPPQLLIVVRFLQGLGAAALSAVSLALIGAYFVTNRGRAYGVYNAIKGAGYVVSPVVGALIVVRSGFAAIFVATALIGAAAFAVALFLPRPPTDPRPAFDDGDDDLSWAGLRSVFREPALRPWYAVTVVNMFFVGILFGFLPVRVHELGLDPFASGLVLSAVAVSYLAVQPVAGALADRVSAAATIRVGLLLAGAGIIAAPFVDGSALVVVSMAAGVGVGTVWTNTDALISGLARRGRLGATMGAAGSFKELGDMLGPLLVGLLSQAFGLPFGFVVCGILGLGALVLVTVRPLGARSATSA
jgi:MFS family permease